MSAFSRMTISRGVLAGAKTPNQVPISKPRRPDSLIVGSSAAFSILLFVVFERTLIGIWFMQRKP